MCNGQQQLLNFLALLIRMDAIVWLGKQIVASILDKAVMEERAWFDFSP
jgi:hypothetical protein